MVARCSLLMLHSGAADNSEIVHEIARDAAIAGEIAKIVVVMAFKNLVFHVIIRTIDVNTVIRERFTATLRT